MTAPAGLAVLLALLPAQDAPDEKGLVVQDRYRCELYCSAESAPAAANCPNCRLPLRPESFFDDKLRLGKSAAILLFPGVQVIDFSGPFEVLGAAGVRVYTVAKEPGPLRTDEGLTVVPDFALADCPPVDLVVVPGGKIYADDVTTSWVRERASDAEIVLSVCNGLAWLDEAELLEGLQVTTTATSLGRMLGGQDGTRYRADRRVVDAGEIVTSGGYTSGIDGALHVVARWKGLGAAKLIAAKLEYEWRPDDGIFPRYRAYYVHLRALVQSLERAVPDLKDAPVVDAELRPDRASATWEVDVANGGKGVLDGLRAAVAGIAGGEMSDRGGVAALEWRLDATEDADWTARCEIHHADAAETVRMILSVRASARGG